MVTKTSVTKQTATLTVQMVTKTSVTKQTATLTVQMVTKTSVTKETAALKMHIKDTRKMFVLQNDIVAKSKFPVS